MGSLTQAFVDDLTYPIARRDNSVADNYHGVLVPDPYRWLEDPDSDETKEFVEKQVELTDSMLKKCDVREKLGDKLTKLYDFPKYEVPFIAGDKYFYFYNSGLQPQKVLFVQDTPDGKAEILLDPNTFSDDGTVALSVCTISEDAKYLAYGISSSGSDWVTIKVMRIEDKDALPDTVSWVKFSDVSWTLDSKGFFYSRYPAPIPFLMSPISIQLSQPINPTPLAEWLLIVEGAMVPPESVTKLLRLKGVGQGPRLRTSSERR
ncbi:hypothetical protein DM860_007258 [Cuscuta australis]|uniref:Peptidase S9A N-terminal domain-containing protein n=1 Tax=Cuscuta australis TaxID=267555 RepID=A0A328E7D9_9ASTE|nr:hypothetical protein DM860_007258 [Cuscuta australis]